MEHITDRLYNKKWGVFNHYLYGRAKDAGMSWCDAVNSIDVKKIADQLEEIGAGYYFITLCQGTRYVLAPNKTYERITDAKPFDAIPERDVVSELYDELSARGIDLYLYFPSDGPHDDAEFGPKLGFSYNISEAYDMEKGILRPYSENTILTEKKLNDKFIENWSSVLKEYAERYGDKICGWWLDGYYDYFGYNQVRMKPFYDVIKKANPNAIVAFNGGVMDYTRKYYENADYTAGEFNDLFYIPPKRFTDDGAQNHILAPLGSTWGKPDVMHDNEYMRKYISDVNKNGGVVTVDISIRHDGSFEPEQMKALMLKGVL